MSTLPAKKPNFKAVNRPAAIRHGRKAGWAERDINRFLADIDLGGALTSEAMVNLERAMIAEKVRELREELARANKALGRKDLPDDLRIQLMEAKCKLLDLHNQVSEKLSELLEKDATARGSVGTPAHAFGPREQVGPLQAVQITIGGAEKSAAQHDTDHARAKPIDTESGS